MRPSILNVDLEITSASKLDSVIAEMGKRVVVLHSGPAAARKKHPLVLESSQEHRGPDATIHALCSVIEVLSPAARRMLDSARKEFDVGYEQRAAERLSLFELRPDKLVRVARLGATLAVSYDRDESDDGNK